MKEFALFSHSYSQRFVLPLVGGMGVGTRNPYHASNRLLRVEVELTEFETYDETVTFHDIAVPVPKDNKDATIAPLVPQAQTVKTPGGIAVTLKASDGNPPNVRVSGQGRLLAPLFGILPVTSAEKAVDLPASPLVRKYRKPIRISLRAAAPFKQQMSDNDNTNARVYMNLPTAMPTHLKELFSDQAALSGCRFCPQKPAFRNIKPAGSVSSTG